MRNHYVFWSVLVGCIFVGLLGCTNLSAESEEVERKNYGVPAGFANTVNPIVADAASLQRGEEIYNVICINCHGEGGQGNGPAIANENRKPSEFNAEHVRELKDGELYYIITHGVDDSPMLAWSFFDDEDIWHLVNYIRMLQK